MLGRPPPGAHGYDVARPEGRCWVVHQEVGVAFEVLYKKKRQLFASLHCQPHHPSSRLEGPVHVLAGASDLGGIARCWAEELGEERGGRKSRYLFYMRIPFLRRNAYFHCLFHQARRYHNGI